MANSHDKSIYKFNRLTTAFSPHLILDLNENETEKSTLSTTTPSSKLPNSEPLCSDLCTTILPILASLIFLFVVGKCMMTFCMPNWLRLRQRFNRQIFNERFAYHYSSQTTQNDPSFQRNSVSIISELSNSLSRGMDSHQMTTNSSRQLDNDLIQQYLRCSYGEIFLQTMPPSYDEAQKEEELQHCSAASTIASTINNNSTMTSDGDSMNIYNIWQRNCNNLESVALSPDIADYYRSSARLNSVSTNPIHSESEFEEQFNSDDRQMETHRFRILTGRDSIPAPPDDFDVEHCPPPPSYPNSARPSLVARGSVVSALVPLRRLSVANPPTGVSSTFPEDLLDERIMRQNSASSSGSIVNDKDSPPRPPGDAYNAEIESVIERGRPFLNTEDISWRPTCHTIVEESVCHLNEADSTSGSEVKDVKHLRRN